MRSPHAGEHNPANQPQPYPLSTPLHQHRFATTIDFVTCRNIIRLLSIYIANAIAPIWLLLFSPCESNSNILPLSKKK
jgi:hypothetical protein